MYKYTLSPKINLLVAGRIAPTDAERQVCTAREILERLRDKPGQVLADEVGMGKTFVALAVAASVALQDKRPVVVMVPPSVRDKWPAELETFLERCLPPKYAGRLSHASASAGVEFLKLLDDPPSRRNSIIFLTHGALASRLSDGWVQFSVIQAALRYRRGADGLKRAICRFAGDLLHMTWVDRRDPEIWSELIRVPAKNWLKVMQRREFQPRSNSDANTIDDPVPTPVLEVLRSMDLETLHETLKRIPRRQTASYQQRMSDVREEIRKAINEVWVICLRRARVSLPLLVLDEAHHLKNPGTRLASLFHTEDADSDVEVITKGALAGIFERMLFLTATPFQLGHHELCSVLTRFEGIDWDKKSTAPSGGIVGYRARIAELREKLDGAQHSAHQLESAWSRIRPEQLTSDGDVCKNEEEWWQAVNSGCETSEAAKNVVDYIGLVEGHMRGAEAQLRDWVIRHNRSRNLPMASHRVPRRRRFTGAALLDLDDGTDDRYQPGLSVAGEPLLPFLLATRLVALTPESRPVFAEGLASSFEAFRETRRVSEQATGASTLLDEDASLLAESKLDARMRWYLDRIDESISKDGRIDSGLHPKIAATLETVVKLWLDGEKVVIFCHYIATGRALRRHISRAIDEKVKDLACRKLGCDTRRVAKELERLSKRFDADAPAARACNHEIGELLSGFGLLQEYETELREVVRRFVRTPTFLVRYFDLKETGNLPDQVHQAFGNHGHYGRSLRDVVTDFFRFLEERCGVNDRAQYIDALATVQTGDMYGLDVIDESYNDPRRARDREGLVATVRLVNGATKQDTRRRLMLAFNTPFYPEVLIASSVMAEGIDLHLNCRHVLHYDLSWNPSNVEQRTGRVDRIGAKAERVGHPINVFMPFIAETQDEKRFRVVMDRERWFDVLMGGGFELEHDARSTDAIAERVPFPMGAAAQLSLKLNVVE